MTAKDALKTGYLLPFRVSYSRERVFSAGGPLLVVARCRDGATVDRKAVVEIFDLFGQLAKTGALAGRGIPPGQSGLEVGTPAFGAGLEFSVLLEKCAVDDRALVVLTHLFLARYKAIPLQSLEVAPRGEAARIDLRADSEDEESTYPEVFAKLPYELQDEEPEGGGFTFTAELEEPALERNADILQGALSVWTEAVVAGAYALAPIPPQESWCEPDSDEVVWFKSTLEWIVFKVRADDACIHALVNIFAAFHERCQKLRSLVIA